MSFELHDIWRYSMAKPCNKSIYISLPAIVYFHFLKGVRCQCAGMVTVVSGGSVSRQSMGGNGQISMNGETLIISDRTARWS